MDLKSITKSKGVKRNIGASVVIVPMLIQYGAKIISQSTGADWEIDNDLLNILYVVGSSVWGIPADINNLKKNEESL